MGAPAWTPGPWKADNGTVATFWYIGSEAEDVVYLTLRGDTDKGRANARLIAAAPKLYEALEAILPCAFDGPEYDAAVDALASARDEQVQS